ncbi:MAG TPA: 1-acyl-sn-glycerol-3-phosphate acyltransferase [Hyphomicrobiales bacterium]|nr:1-acyl-sn-glycerol-3-phosphate acyltransferase [Hyphomicrobiales bacterium]
MTMTSIFDTPLLTPCLRQLARGALALSGWKIEPHPPLQPPFVFIGAPHTSNWDCLLLVALSLDLELQACWLGKDSLFRFPLGGLMRWLGGIPIDRSHPCNQVELCATYLRAHPRKALCVTPEGTRRPVQRWKTGFYHIARQADVPILLTVLDAESRTVRLRGWYHPSGEDEREILEIQQFYRGIRGIIPANTTELPMLAAAAPPEGVGAAIGEGG